MKIYIDESGNTGDVIKKNIDLSFSGQDIFSLAGLQVSDELSHQLEQFFIPKLKKDYKIQGNELKSKNLFDSKPNAIFDLVEFLLKNESFNYFIELTDKKYYICNSIVWHQIYPSYFVPKEEESKGEIQSLRQIYADILTREFSEFEYKIFFDCCNEKSEKSLYESFDSIINFCKRKIKESNSQFLNNLYQSMINNIEETKDDYLIIKESKKELAVCNFIPIPDNSKKNNDIHLLPHLSSLTNIIARANFANQGISNIEFIHDRQVYFDDILTKTVASMTRLNNLEFEFVSANFNIEKMPNINFKQDSENSIGIQLADIFAGFTMRYISKFLKNEPMENIYHDIYNKIECGRINSINYMLPISYYIRLDKNYHRSLITTNLAKLMEQEYVDFLHLSGSV